MNRTLLATVLAATALTPVASMAQDSLRIAYLAASSQNSYNQATWAGVQAAAAEVEGVEVELFDGEFSATVQFSQVEDIVAGGRFDAIVIAPNDTVGIAAALEEATAAGIKVATVLFPVGPELTNMEPQVEGLTTTVATNPAAGAAAQAEAVAAYCADKDPCKVVAMIGQLMFPFDNLRNDSMMAVFANYPNIDVVATGEGNYSPDTALTAMTDILQANPDIHAVISTADQHLLGIEIALEDAGIDPASVYTIGGGLNQITVDKIRAGVFSATLSGYPYGEGYLAAQALIRSLNGEEVPTWINPADGAVAPVIVDKAWLDANPEYTAEWEG